MPVEIDTVDCGIMVYCNNPFIENDIMRVTSVVLYQLDILVALIRRFSSIRSGLYQGTVHLRHPSRVYSFLVPVQRSESFLV